MLRPLVSYGDLAGRHGRKPALRVLLQLEQLARIESGTVASIDLEARFARALKIVANTNNRGPAA
jgi:hypothetical protein